MKRFRFPLRPVSILRSHQELRAREKFAASVHTYVQAEAGLASTRERVAELERLMRCGREVSYSAGSAASLFQAYRSECAEEMAAERTVIETRDQMNHCREEYLVANRRLKVVNQLEEKALARHWSEAMRADQLELDDLAGIRARRRSVLS